MVKVYHNTQLFKPFTDSKEKPVMVVLTFGTDEEKASLAHKLFNEGVFELVGEMNTDRLEHAYLFSQNSDEPWVMDPMNVHANKKPVRSTSVGDLFEKDGRKYLVSDFGFQEI